MELAIQLQAPKMQKKAEKDLHTTTLQQKYQDANAITTPKMISIIKRLDHGMSFWQKQNDLEDGKN